VTATWRAYKRARLFRQPLLHADPPHLHPGQRRLPVQADADVRVAAQRRPRLGAEAQGRRGGNRPRRSRGGSRLLPRAQVSELRQPAPRDIASRAPRKCATKAAAWAPAACGVYLDFADAIKRLGKGHRERYGNLFEMYERITGEDAYKQCRCASTRPCTTRWAAVGGLQPDEQHARPARAGRGELLRPRRQPPRRQRADAGPGRRLFRDSVHHRRLPRDATSSRR
jgi:hypothetical protein